MRLFVFLALSAFAQEYEDEVATTEAATEAPATDAPVTDAPLIATSAEEETAVPMENDYVQTYDSYDYGYYEATEAPAFDGPQQRNGGGGSVYPVNNLGLSLLANGDFEFTWTYDATHTDYNFEYQELVGNYQNATDYIQYSAGSVSMTTDGAITTTTLTPPNDNTVYRWRITPFVGADAGYPASIDGQSYTDTVIHQPGDVYNGGGGYGAQILFPTDFSSASFLPTSGSDSIGYVMAILVQFPAGCPSIDVAADVDANYIYIDPSNPDTHRIFVFPETHFSNQFSGAIKNFHYYVSGAAYGGCDLSDPANSVTVSNANYFLLRTTEAAPVDAYGMWPSGNVYPPAEYTEQHVVNLTDYIQPATHIGPSRALSAPRVYFSTGACNVILNVEAGSSPGWGMLNEFNGNLDMTDLWASPPTSNTGTDFALQALLWLTQVGVTFRYDIGSSGCETITSSATITFIELDPSANLAIA